MKRLMVIALAALLASPINAQQTSLSSQEVREASAAFLANGDPARAAAFADLILAVRPNDYQALIIRTRAAIALGDFEGATTLAKRAYRGTDNPRAKFLAARLAARGHVEQEEDTFAQLWLRRARQFAPDDESAQQIARDYRLVAQRNPWSTNLRFGISPSNNINNGTEADFFFLRSLPFAFIPDESARPLSGFEISLGASTRYRLNMSETSVTFLDFDIEGRTYRLSRDAKDKVPDARGSDYADAGIGFGVTHRRILVEGARPTTFSARVGQTWYSGDAYTRNYDLTASHGWTVGERNLVGVSGALQRRVSLDDDPDVDVYRLGANWTQVYENRNRLSAAIFYSVSASDTLDQDYTGVRLTTNYAINEPIADLRLGFGFDAEVREFDATAYGNDTRSDNRLTARLSAGFSELEFYGFQPVATLEATRNDSDVELFDREYINFGFDLKSSF